jgi:hypothetical protein
LTVSFGWSPPSVLGEPSGTQIQQIPHHCSGIGELALESRGGNEQFRATGPLAKKPAALANNVLTELKRSTEAIGFGDGFSRR